LWNTGKFALASGEEVNNRQKDREVYCPQDYLPCNYFSLKMHVRMRKNVEVTRLRDRLTVLSQKGCMFHSNFGHSYASFKQE